MIKDPVYETDHQPTASVREKYFKRSAPYVSL